MTWTLNEIIEVINKDYKPSAYSKNYYKKQLQEFIKQECINFAFDCIAAKRRIGNATELRKSIEELYNQNHKPCKQTER